MTTTLTAVVVDRGELAAAHIGDSRLYLAARRRGSPQLTKDHTVAGEKARMGLMSKSRAREHPDRSVLTRSLGRELIVPIDRLSNRVYRGRRAAGLQRRALQRPRRRRRWPAARPRGRRRRLPHASSTPPTARGTLDNLSAAVLRVLDGPERPDGLGRPRAAGSGPSSPTRRLKLRPASRKDPARQKYRRGG